MALTDDSVLMFGNKHYGEKLEDVPDEYLWWMYNNIKPNTSYKRALMDYILANLDAIKKNLEIEDRPFFSD